MAAVDHGEAAAVRGFWSLTLYNEHHFFHPDELDRYLFGTKITWSLKAGQARQPSGPGEQPPVTRSRGVAGPRPDGAVRHIRRSRPPTSRRSPGPLRHEVFICVAGSVRRTGGRVVLDTGGRYYRLRLGRHRRMTGTRNFRTSDLTPGRRRNNPRPGPRCSPAGRCRGASRRRARPRDRPAPCR